jgi:hypothetical protein
VEPTSLAAATIVQAPACHISNPYYIPWDSNSF